MQEEMTDITTGTCCFCGSPDNNEVLYGEILQKKDIVTHYFCLILSSFLPQNGKDREGIRGFMPQDIHREIKRGRKLRCAFCKQLGATIACTARRCKTVFHLSCGRQRGSLHQFFGQFRSFCPKHRPRQKIDEDIRAAVKNEQSKCAICFEKLNTSATLETIWAPCCRKNGWFHRNCVQKFAQNAGYFFKCPLCNNEKEFTLAMQTYGVYVPKQDASWETEPNAYENLLQRYDKCDAEPCKCPHGPRYDLEHSPWEIILCGSCGSQGIHISCANLQSAVDWFCPLCKDVLNKVQIKKTSEHFKANIPIHRARSDNLSRQNSQSRWAMRLPARAPRRRIVQASAEAARNAETAPCPSSAQRDYESAVPNEQPAAVLPPSAPCRITQKSSAEAAGSAWKAQSSTPQWQGVEAAASAWKSQSSTSQWQGVEAAGSAWKAQSSTSQWQGVEAAVPIDEPSPAPEAAFTSAECILEEALPAVCNKVEEIHELCKVQQGTLGSLAGGRNCFTPILLECEDDSETSVNVEDSDSDVDIEDTDCIIVDDLDGGVVVQEPGIGYDVEDSDTDVEVVEVE